MNEGITEHSTRCFQCPPQGVAPCGALLPFEGTLNANESKKIRDYANENTWRSLSIIFNYSWIQKSRFSIPTTRRFALRDSSTIITKGYWNEMNSLYPLLIRKFNENTSNRCWVCVCAYCMIDRLLELRCQSSTRHNKKKRWLRIIQRLRSNEGTTRHLRCPPPCNLCHCMISPMHLMIDHLSDHFPNCTALCCPRIRECHNCSPSD